VDAKRYLCATREGYHDALSEDSKRSLALQGGIFTAEQCERFVRRPGAAEAIRVRVWDDLAKQVNCPTEPLAYFMARAKRCLRH
jgi:predicted HD phosphohydrolase